jgi:tetratricopeptide (TPR) repeat protein
MNKALRAGLLLLLVLLPSASRASGGTEPFVSPDAPGQAERPLSEREALALAGRFLEQGRTDEAAALFRTLMASARNPEYRIEAAFQLAGMAVREGKYREAVALYRNILNQRPDLPRVRLELARAHFLDRNYEDAAFQFEMVRGGDLPPEVLANVDRYLDAIRRRKNWTLDFFLSPVSDSNINQASGGREECIDTVFGTLCRPLEDQSSGLGLAAGATVDYFRRFSQDWGLRATVGVNTLTYENHDYNDHSLYAALGPRLLWQNGEASLQPTWRKRRVADRPYSDEYGLRLDVRQHFGPLILDAGASWAVMDYADSYVHGFLHGPTWSLRLQSRYILNDRTFVQIGLQYLREDAHAKEYANGSQRYALGGYRIFPHGFALFLEGSLIRTDYRAPQWYVTRDNRIEETIRRDTVWGFLASLSNSACADRGVTPVLQYSYTRRDSNIRVREYERHRLNMMLNVRF